MITKKQFMDFERVRRSGQTNMFDVAMVGVLSGLSQQQILEIMKNYTELYHKYMEEKYNDKKETQNN